MILKKVEANINKEVNVMQGKKPDCKQELKCLNQITWITPTARPTFKAHSK